MAALGLAQETDHLHHHHHHHHKSLCTQVCVCVCVCVTLCVCVYVSMYVCMWVMGIYLCLDIYIGSSIGWSLLLKFVVCNISAWRFVPITIESVPTKFQ